MKEKISAPKFLFCRNKNKILKTQLAMAMRHPDQGRALTKEIYEGSKRIRELEEKIQRDYPPEVRGHSPPSSSSQASLVRNISRGDVNMNSTMMGTNGGMKQTKMPEFTSSTNNNTAGKDGKGKGIYKSG